MTYDFQVKHVRIKLVDMTQNQYDLLVIGGGITGSGIALDATHRGMKSSIS